MMVCNASENAKHGVPRVNVPMSYQTALKGPLSLAATSPSLS